MLNLVENRFYFFFTMDRREPQREGARAHFLLLFFFQIRAGKRAQKGKSTEQHKKITFIITDVLKLTAK